MCKEFQDAISGVGLVPPDHIPAGTIIAFAGLNKSTANKAARCLLFQDGKGGWFMDYSTGLYEVWQAKRGKPYSAEERRAFRQRCEADKQARDEAIVQGHLKAAGKANHIWKRAIFADAGNPYLHRKRVQAHGAKTVNGGSLKGVLIVPLFNASLKRVNVQLIHPDGTKRFLKGGQKQSCFWWLGKPSDTVLVAEGFATAASLYQATGNQTFMAIDSGNLVNVAKIVRAKKPNADIIIMGDNDLNGNGQKAARAAALACGGKYLVPPTVDYDWNDQINAGKP